MRGKAGLIIKLVVGAASIGIGIAEKIIADKEMKKTVAKEVAKALSK